MTAAKRATITPEDLMTTAGLCRGALRACLDDDWDRPRSRDLQVFPASGRSGGAVLYRTSRRSPPFEPGHGNLTTKGLAKDPIQISSV